jgi:Ca-activated chloride channel homolog
MEKKKQATLFLPFFLLLFFTQSLFSQSGVTTRILFVFDDSFSMFGQWQTGVKIDKAKLMFSEFLDSLKGKPNLEIALRCYGHQSPLHPQRNCEDTKLEVPFAPVNENIPKMKARVKTLTPLGTTPIAYTLGQCANDFPKGKSRNVIILITDGIEECGGNPCEVSAELQKKGIVLKPFIIGIGMTQAFSDQIGCIGKFYDASSEESFKNILNIIIRQVINNTTVQVNLLDKSGKPNETDVNMTFYDQQTGNMMYNYMHTINHRGNPDTINLDPINTYKMVVHTIPPVEKENISITPGKHNVIAVDAPQGYLYVKVNGSNNYKNLPVIVRKKGEMKTLHVQPANKTEKYIVGSYDLEILTLPRINLSGVNIAQNHTTTVEIQESGVVSILKPTPGPSSIYLEDGKKLVWVCNLDNSVTQESVVLQPGSYRIEYRPANAKESIYTVERKFTINPGGSTVVKLY